MDGVLMVRLRHILRDKLFSPAAIRRRPLIHLLLLAVLMAASWEAASAFELMRRDTWPPPSEIVQTLWRDLWTAESSELGDQNRATPLAGHLLLTLQKWLVGFVIASLLGVAVGATLGTSKTMFAVGFPVVSVLRAMPSAAVWPIAVLLIGLGFKSQLVTITFGALWPALLNTLNALTSLSPEVRDSMEFMQLSPLQKFVTQIHWGLPGIFTGLELSCSIAFLLAVTVEVFDSSNGGIGWYMDFHKGTSEYAHMYAGVLLTGLVGWALNSLMHLVRGTVLFWERGANRRSDIVTRTVTALMPRNRVAQQVADKIGDDRLKQLVTVDDVTRELNTSFSGWQLELLYLGTPYFWPYETRRLGMRQCVQRDIRIHAPYGEAGRRSILVAQSWLDLDAFSRAGREALEAGRLTLGQIVRATESGLAFSTDGVEACISEKLGLAFGTNGAVEAVKRVRVLRSGGRNVGILHEYVPVLVGNAKVFTT